LRRHDDENRVRNMAGLCVRMLKAFTLPSPLLPSRHPCESRGPVRVRLQSNARRKRPFGWAVSAQRTKIVLCPISPQPSGFLLAQECRRDSGLLYGEVTGFYPFSVFGPFS
jgi:hypothetical protein